MEADAEAEAGFVRYPDGVLQAKPISIGFLKVR
jgi:hypothetical protein